MKITASVRLDQNNKNHCFSDRDIHVICCAAMDGKIQNKATIYQNLFCMISLPDICEFSHFCFIVFSPSVFGGLRRFASNPPYKEARLVRFPSNYDLDTPFLSLENHQRHLIEHIP